MKISEIKQIIREELERKLDEFVSGEMQKGTHWKVSDRGYGAKNLNGATDYFYGDNDADNLQKARAFSKDNSRKQDKIQEVTTGSGAVGTHPGGTATIMMMPRGMSMGSSTYMNSGQQGDKDPIDDEPESKGKNRPKYITTH